MDLNNVSLLANDGNVNRGGRGNGLPYAMSKLKKINYLTK